MSDAIIDFSNWLKDPELEGLKLFSLLINEMLFDYTIDSYQAYTLNTHTLIEELNDVMIEVKKGFIPIKALSPIIEEIKKSYKEDFVIKEALGFKKKLFEKKLKEIENIINNPKNYSNDHIKNYISDFEICRITLEKNYYQKLQEEIIKYTQRPNEKNKISILTKLLIPELINKGFSKSYIYSTNKSFFLEYNKISNHNQIYDFFSKFSGSTVLYDVTFKVNSEFCKFDQELINKFDISISTECPKVDLESIYYDEFKKTNEEFNHFLSIKNLPAKDPETARMSGEKYLEKILDFIKYHIHDSNCSWENTGLCIYSSLGNDTKKLHFVAKPGIQPIFKIKDRESKTNALIKSIMLFDNLDKTSTYNLYNSLNLHSCSLSSKTFENQLINLWIALESLLPPPPNGDGKRIIHFMETMSPILGRDYILKLINDLYRNFELFLDDKDRDKLFSYVDEKLSNIEKCIHLIIIYNGYLKENPEELESPDKTIEIDSIFGENVLLRNRFFNICQLLKTTNSLKSKIENHDERVKWHLQRIYRARNLITHKGEELEYISNLLEHTHNYYHTIIDQIIKTKIEHKKQFTDIGMILQFIKIEHKSHLESLTENREITLDNYKQFIYGY